MAPLNVAIYARVSTADQNCEMQLTDLRAEAKRRGWPAYKEYIDHASGAKARRPALDEMMADAAAGKFGVVMVWKLDRFSRSVLHLCQQVEALEKAKVRFLCPGQGIDTDSNNPMAALMLHILAAIAMFERALILERSKAGRERIMGDLVNPRPDSWILPLGFRVVDGFPEYDPAGLKALRYIHDLRGRGKSVYQIQDLLIDAGIKSRRDGKIGHSAIVKLIKNRCCVGEYFRAGRVWPILDRNGNLLAPIPRAQFDRNQELMNAVRQATVGRPPNEASKLVLRGKVRCWRCGERCVGYEVASGWTPEKKTLHYRCGRQTRRKKAPCKGCGSPNALKLETTFWREFWRLLKEPARVHASALALSKKAEKPTTNDPRAQLKKARAQFERIREMTEQRMYTVAEGKAKANEVMDRIARLEIEARALGKVIEIAPLDVVAEACAAIASGPEPEREDQREVIERIQDLRVTVKDGVMVAMGNIPIAAASVANSGNTVGSRKKNCAHNLPSVANTFEPIPFRIEKRIA